MNTFLARIVLISLIHFLVSGDTVSSRLLRPKARNLDAARSITTYGIYTCPLDLTGKKCDKRDLLPYAPYGVKHTYLKIGNICYDWGDWDYSRHVDCSSSEVSCCTDDGTLEYEGTTSCVDSVSRFEAAWEAAENTYSIWSWNCQTYVDAMKDFLNNCYNNPFDAIPC